MKNFISQGNYVDVPAPAKVASGSPLLVGSLFGVATCDADAGEMVSLCVSGVVELALKTDEPAMSAGAKAYWNTTGVTATASGNTFIGHVLPGAPEGYVWVRI